MGMSGDIKGINGGKMGTGGRVPWPLFVVIAGFLLAVIIVNITSHMIEKPELDLWEPVLWEMSSYVAILILLPAVYDGYRRFHWRRLGVPRFLAVQLGLAFVFSGLHIAMMVAIRIAGYALALSLIHI